MGENLLHVVFYSAVSRRKRVGLPEVINSLAHPAQPDKGYPKIIVRLCTVRIDAKGLLQVRLGLLLISLLNI